MRGALALWLFLLVLTSTGAVATYVSCPGCLPRGRFNKACEWTGDAAFPLDVRNPAQREHLVEDAQLAEELGIRFADAEFRRRGGHEAHGGLLDGGRLRGDCLSRLFAAIEHAHGVTSEQVQGARGHRNRTFDFAVALLFVPLYSLGAAAACRSILRRFSSSERYARLIATCLVSVAVSLLGVQCLRLWGGVWEVIRVGNGHMTSIRAASRSGWIHQYRGADLIGAMAVFWLTALICHQVVSDDDHAADVPGVSGLIVR